MSKRFITKNKSLFALIAVLLAIVILLGGTFAWQSISQQALNEVYGTVNPGGRLHDDFNDITAETDAKTMTFDKNVYAENFTTLADNGVQIFTRIRLDEYMEFGVGAGNEDPEKNKAISLVYGADLTDKSTWTTHIPGNVEDPFHEYWNWDTAGENQGKVTYMPTFDKNKDSLRADINGTFEGGYTDYTQTKLKTGDAVYDDDDNTADEILESGYTVEQAVQNGFVSTEQETHAAKESLPGYVMTMDEWVTLPSEKQVGNFWVWDNDGWAYWANPIDPSTATGLLLDGISRTETIINEDWYYGINVVAQFITKDDMGKENGTGFYDTEAGAVPSSNALELLNAIGVDVNSTAHDADSLAAALKLGGNITIDGEINAQVVNTDLGDAYGMEYFWTTGGKLTGGTLIVDQNAYAGLFINAEKDYPKGTGARKAIVNHVTLTGKSGNLIYAQAIDETITLNEVIATNTWGNGVFAEWGGSRVTLNGCTISAPMEDTTAEDYQQTAVAAANGAEVVINEGTYTGMYAAYVYSTGGSITINGGTFNGKLAEAAGDLIIKGGLFSEDPTAYLADGYTAEKDTATGMWKVK